MTHAEIYGSNDSPSIGTAMARSSQSMPDGQFVELSDAINEDTIPHIDRSHSTRIPSRADSYTPRPLRQQGMVEAYQLSKRKVLDEKWAAFFYEANVAFNVARHPTFIAAVEETSKAGFDYRPPTYNAMRTKHIEPTKKQVKLQIEEKTRQCITLYGATICSDGWDNVTRRPLMNVMLVCPVGDIFLGSIDTTGSKKDKSYIAGKLKEYIDEVGPQNVVQICSDNASAMLGAMDKVVEEYPHIYKQGCAAHIIDLLLEDWGKEPTFRDLIVLAKRICNYIRNRHATMALFREESPKLSLILPAETRFGCAFLMISRLLKVKDALERVIAHPKWQEHVNSLFNRQNGHRTHQLAMLVQKTINSPSFWARCENFVHIVEPALVTLRTFDGQTPAMGKAWLAMSNLEKHVSALRDAPFSLDPRIATRFEHQFHARWKMMLTDLHYAGALLNPYLTECVELQSCGDAKRARNRVLRHLSACLGLNYNDVMDELTQFEERTGPYGPLEAPDIRETRMLPHQWWQRVGGDYLPLIAKRILSLTCSASSCERNWSMYSFVHNKARNRLGVKKAEDLVYIYTNSKLLRERRGADPVIWYNNQQFSEDSDVESGNVEEGNDDGGNEDVPNRHEVQDTDVRDSTDDSDDDNGDDSGADGPMGNIGGNMSHEDPINLQRRNESVPPANGVFDWTGLDEEEPEENVNVVNNLDDEDINLYDRADDDIEDDQGISEDLLNEENGNNCANPPVHDNGGLGNGGVPISTCELGGDGNEIHEPHEAIQRGGEGILRCAKSRETILANHDHSSTQEIAEEDDVPISHMLRRTLVQSTFSIGAKLAILARTLPTLSPSAGGENVEKTFNSRLNSMASQTCVKPGIEVTPSSGNRGVKRSSFGPKIVRPFHSGYIGGSSSISPMFVGTRGVNEDGVTDNNKRRKLKKIVTTMVDGEIVGEMRNLTSTVEEYAPNAYGDENEVCGDDEFSDGSDDSHAEAPNDGDVVLRAPLEVAGSRKNPKRYKSKD